MLQIKHKRRAKKTGQEVYNSLGLMRFSGESLIYLIEKKAWEVVILLLGENVQYKSHGARVYCI
jgi:hypothetical protein